MFGKRQHMTVPALTLGVISAVLLISDLPAHGQTETVVHNFASFPDGYFPRAGLTSYGGNLYGTTYFGGLKGSQGPGWGTVFELSPNGSGGWNETVIHEFCSEPDCADGEWPETNLIADSMGNLYGTTAFGGGADCYGGEGCGVAYELSPGPSGWTFTVLYSFIGNGAGGYPFSALVMDSNGNLYGGAGPASESGSSVTYELSPSAGGWTEQVISNLGCELTMSASGNLFCVSGSQIFELSPNGNGGWNETPVYRFSAATSTVVLDQAGNIYGSSSTNEHSMVYKLTPGKKGWTKKTLFTFGNKKKDGAGSTTLVLDAAGNIYGATVAGGLYGEEQEGLGYGTVFELVPPVGAGKYTEKVLWNFNGTDGEGPYAGVILDGAGNLYGTTSYGGSLGLGTVFEVTP